MTTPTPEAIEAGREGIAERMTWASLHWGKISPDAYQHLATAALFAAAPLIAAQAKAEALREAADALAPSGTLWWGTSGVTVREGPFGPPTVTLDHWLRARAATLEGEN